MNIIYTIGVYHKTEDEFFDILLTNGIEIFCDVRNRRGMRGERYSFVNRSYLQKKLSELKIEYFHIKELSPSKEVRSKQINYDKTLGVSKRQREKLSEEFCQAYTEQVLSKYDFDLFARKENLDNKKIVMFCVESESTSCHRSLITKKMVELNSLLLVINL